MSRESHKLLQKDSISLPAILYAEPDVEAGACKASLSRLDSYGVLQKAYGGSGS